MSRFITKNDEDDFPLLVDDTEDDQYHDSYQVSGMERGGSSLHDSETESSLLVDILSSSFSGGPSDQHTEFLHGKRNASTNRSTFKQQQQQDQAKKCEELEDLYSFSVSEDDDPMLELFEDEAPDENDKEDGDDDENDEDDDGEYFNSSQDMEDMISPNSYRYYKNRCEQLAPLPVMDDDEDGPRPKTVRFADELQSQSQFLFKDDPMLIREESIALIDTKNNNNEDTLLDIFDQDGQTNSDSMFEDDSDEEFSYTGSDFDDDDEEESSERKILRGVMYSGATVGVVAGLGFLGKKLLSAFQKQEDDMEGGNGIENMMGTDQAGADVTHTSIEAGTGSMNNSSQSASNTAAGNTNPSTPNSSTNQ